jgi:hypothetical protein
MLLLAVVGCASRPADPDARAEFDRLNDPLEPTNRNIHAADLLHPLANTSSPRLHGAAFTTSWPTSASLSWR